MDVSNEWGVQAHCYNGPYFLWNNGWHAMLYRHNVVLVKSRKLVGFFAGPRMWFKPLPERMRIARAELLAHAAQVEANERAHRELKAELSRIASGVKEG